MKKNKKKKMKNQKIWKIHLRV